VGYEARRREELSPEERELEELKAYARAVRDEAHWQSILASTDKPEVREELERVVGPLLRFRRGCAYLGCTSTEPARYEVFLSLEAENGDKSLSDVHISVCHPCRGKLTVEDVVTDEIWSEVVQQAIRQGVYVPDRKKTELRFDAL